MLAEEAQFVEASSIYRKRVAQLKPSEAKAGNVTFCQNTPVIRTSASELRRKGRYSDKLEKDLKISKATFAVCMGQTIKGFIQGIGCDPFWVLLYSEEQVRQYIDECRRGTCVLHMDSTGSVMKNIPGQKRPFYYAIVAAGGSIPIVELLTTCHHASWLMSLFDLFLRDAVLLGKGRPWLPQVVVIDFSFALLNCCLLLFNKCSIMVYLEDLWKCLNNLNNAGFYKQTLVKLCGNHLIKSVSTSLYRIERRKNVRKAALVIVSVLQRCTSLTEAAAKYRAAFLLFNNENLTDETAAAKLTLLNKITYGNLPSADNDFDAENATEITKTIPVSKLTIQKRSPFSTFFAEAVRYNDQDQKIAKGKRRKENSGSVPTTANEFYSPAAFRVIRRIMPYYPLWSCVIRSKTLEARIYSNATVESHFRQLKHSTLRKRRNMFPGDVGNLILFMDGRQVAQSFRGDIRACSGNLILFMGGS